MPALRTLCPFTLVRSAHNGLTFAVRYLPKGARYGLRNMLTATQPLVEFYDVRYADDCEAGGIGFGALGQFVSRYDADTILAGNAGINLAGDVPDWRIDAGAMWDARVFIRSHHCK